MRRPFLSSTTTFTSVAALLPSLAFSLGRSSCLRLSLARFAALLGWSFVAADEPNLCKLLGDAGRCILLGALRRRQARLERSLVHLGAVDEVVDLVSLAIDRVKTHVFGFLVDDDPREECPLAPRQALDIAAITAGNTFLHGLEVGVVDTAAEDSGGRFSEHLVFVGCGSFDDAGEAGADELAATAFDGVDE